MNNNDQAREQARAQLESIMGMVAALTCDYDRLEELRDEKESLQYDVDNAETEEEQTDAADALTAWMEENGEELNELTDAAGDCEDQDDARQRIEEDALSVEVRSGWTCPGEPLEPEEFRILLCTGGPACQIIGELNQYGEPDSCRLMFQDWFTPWEELIMTSDEHDAVLTYCRRFYFGRG